MREEKRSDEHRSEETLEKKTVEKNARVGHVEKLRCFSMAVASFA